MHGVGMVVCRGACASDDVQCVLWNMRCQWEEWFWGMSWKRKNVGRRKLTPRRWNGCWPNRPISINYCRSYSNTLTGAPGAPSTGIESTITLFGGKTYTLPLESNSSAHLFPLKICSSTGIGGGKKLALLIVTLSVALLRLSSKLRRTSALPW